MRCTYPLLPSLRGFGESVYRPRQQTLRRYRTHHSNLQSLDSLNQSDIDRIIHQEKPTDSPRMDSGLPKGIDPVTLDKILGRKDIIFSI